MTGHGRFLVAQSLGEYGALAGVAERLRSAAYQA